MTHAEILAAIAASPALQALAAARNDVGLAAALSAVRTKIEPRMISARGLAERYSGGPLGVEVVLMKLEGAAATLSASADPNQKVIGSLLKRQLGFLAGDGLDLGSAALRAMLDQFVVLGILTQIETDSLKSIAVAPEVVTAAEVSATLNGV